MVWFDMTCRCGARSSGYAINICSMLRYATGIPATKGYSHSFRITCDMCAVSLLESREQRYIKDNNNNIHRVFLSPRMSRTTYVMCNMRCCVDVREELGSKPSKFLPHSCSLRCVEDVGLRSESFPPSCNQVTKVGQ